MEDKGDKNTVQNVVFGIAIAVVTALVLWIISGNFAQ